VPFGFEDRLGANPEMGRTANPAHECPDSEVRWCAWQGRTNFGIDKDTRKSLYLVCLLDLKFACANPEMGRTANPAHERHTREERPMSDELVFYTNPMSRGRIVRWMLEEVGQPYRTEMLEFGTTMKGPAYLAVNPMGKVPALRHGDAVVTECGAICAYLADAFPAAGLAPPPGDKARAPYYRWMFFAAGPVEAATTNKAMGWEVPESRRTMAGYGSLEDVLAALELAVRNGPYLLGDTFSAADVYLGSQLAWGMMFGTLEKRPAFEAYTQRLLARAAWQRAKKIDDELTPPEMLARMAN
jgi:glutathione S-transferase